MFALRVRNYTLILRNVININLRNLSSVSSNIIPKKKFCSVNQIDLGFYSKNIAKRPSIAILYPMSNRNMSSNSDIKADGTSDKVKVLSTKDKLKKAVKDYGATVIVFHITISLISLGGFYLLVSSGVDVVSLLDKIGINTSKFVAGTSTFVLAYAIHKVFAPVRISITLGATPIIVRYLRTKNIIK